MQYPDRVFAYRTGVKNKYGDYLVVSIPSAKYISDPSLGFNFSFRNAIGIKAGSYASFLSDADAWNFIKKHFSSNSINYYQLTHSTDPKDLVRIDLNNDIPTYAESSFVKSTKAGDVVVKRLNSELVDNPNTYDNDLLTKRASKGKFLPVSEADKAINILQKYCKQCERHDTYSPNVEGEFKTELFNIPAGWYTYSSPNVLIPKVSLNLTDKRFHLQLTASCDLPDSIYIPDTFFKELNSDLKNISYPFWGKSLYANFFRDLHGGLNISISADMDLATQDHALVAIDGSTKSFISSVNIIFDKIKDSDLYNYTDLDTID